MVAPFASVVTSVVTLLVIVAVSVTKCNLSFLQTTVAVQVLPSEDHVYVGAAYSWSFTVMVISILLTIS